MEYSSKYLSHIVKMTQYHTYRCEMANFKIHSQVHIWLHREPPRVQHSKAQRLRFNCGFLVYMGCKQITSHGVQPAPTTGKGSPEWAKEHQLLVTALPIRQPNIIL